MLHRSVVLPSVIALLFAFSAVAVVRGEDRYNDIEGVVTGPDGAPVANATVKLMKRMGDDRDLHMLTSTTTDRKGKFGFQKVAIGTFVVDASKENLHAMRHIDLDAGDATVAIKLREGGAAVDDKADGYTNIEGTVRDAGKDPLAGVTVRLMGKRKGTDQLKELDSVTTNKKGYFEIYKVAEGTYTIEVSNGKHTMDQEIALKAGGKMEPMDFTFKK